MSQKRLVDTNLIVRHLVQDDQKHAKAAGKLFETCDRGEIKLIVLSPVLAECVFVLESFYQHPRSGIAQALQTLITSPGVEMNEPDIHLDALERYRNFKMHFVDCLLAAYAAAGHIPVATFDADFKKFTDIRIDHS